MQHLGRVLLSNFACLFFFVVCLGVAKSAHAAEWQIETVDARPGAGAEMVLSLVGDGVTDAVVVEIYFDEARLQLPNRRGEIPGAGRNGAYCYRNADNRVDVLLFNDSRPLPVGKHPVCVLPFKVQPNAPNGSAGLELVNAECSGRGQP